MIVLIAACAGKNRVIGKDGDLPWHFPGDLKFFKETTLGHAVLMGRVTYQSILKRLGKPLPGRENYVLSRDPSFMDARVKIIRDLKEIEAWRKDDNPLFVIGGAKIFAQTLPIAGRLLITQIEKDFAGDVFFPEIDPARWRLESEHGMTENGVKLAFQDYRLAA